jgi:alkylated DNA repair dioxygenase AlkB
MIKGLTYIPDFIDEEHAHDLLYIIDLKEWSNDLKRRTQHYGYKYDYTKKTVDTSMYLGKLPWWTEPITTQLVESGIISSKPDQLIVNEYNPGQGIARHTDCVPCFGPVIVSLSLNSTCMMEFEQFSSTKKGTMMLAPRSLLVLTDEARYDWMHSIPARHEDLFQDELITRTRRVSLTFRTVIIGK